MNKKRLLTVMGGKKEKFIFNPTTGATYNFTDSTKLYITSALSTNVSSDNDPIGGVKDSNLNGNNLVQATESKRPTYKLNTLNGLPSALFDAALLPSLVSTLNLGITTGDFCMFCIANPDATADTKRVIGFVKDGTPYQGSRLEYGSDESFTFGINGATTALVDPSISATWHAYYAERKSGIAKLFKDGSPLIAKADTSDMTGHGVVCVGVERPGSTAEFDGHLGQVGVASGKTLTSKELALFETYIKDTYNIFTTKDLPISITSSQKVLDLNGNIGGHPSVVKVGSTYYMLASDNLAGFTMYTSIDGIAWTSQGQVMAPGVQAWASDHLYAPHMEYIDGVFYVVFVGGTAADYRSIGVARNTGDPVNDSWEYYASNPIFNYDTLSGTDIMDPQLIYFENSFDPGNGDGNHKFWMLFSDGSPAKDSVQEIYLAYADAMFGTWTLANSGSTVMNRGNAAWATWPGQCMKIGSDIYYIFSSGITGSTPARGWLSIGKTSDLITWTYPLFEPFTVDGGLSAYERLIEPTIIIVGNELWIYCAASSNGIGSSTRDDIVLLKCRLNLGTPTIL